MALTSASPSPFARTVPTRVRPPEAREDVRDVVGRDAAPGVRHGQPHAAPRQPRDARRVTGSNTRSSTRSSTGPADGVARRTSAWTRATSSVTENGFAR